MKWAAWVGRCCSNRLTFCQLPAFYTEFWAKAALQALAGSYVPDARPRMNQDIMPLKWRKDEDLEFSMFPSAHGTGTLSPRCRRIKSLQFWPWMRGICVVRYTNTTKERNKQPTPTGYHGLNPVHALWETRYWKPVGTRASPALPIFGSFQRISDTGHQDSFSSQFRQP